MDTPYKLVDQEIENGKYFEEAQKWYKQVFVKPAFDSAFMIVVIAIIVLSLTISISSLYTIYPLTTKVRVIVPMEDTINYYPKIKKIVTQGKSVKQAVSEYLSAQYVSYREGYDKSDFKYKYKFITKSSSKDVFNQYYQNLTSVSKVSNNISIASVSKMGGKVNIEIISTSFDSKNDRVNVKFNKKIYNKVGEKLGSIILEAAIKYYISDYDFSKSTNSKLKFIVTKYDLKKIS